MPNTIPTLLSIAEGSKHLLAGNEAYGFEDDGDIAKCLNYRGFVTKWNQPSREAVDDKGKTITVTAPPMVAILKSAPPHYYESKGLPADWAGQN